MTKTEKLRRARGVRRMLARFIELQDAGVRAYVRKSSDPDYVAMNRLLFAQKELNELIKMLREQGYGQ